MSSNIITNIKPEKERLVNLLKEINSMEIKSPESKGDQGIFQLLHEGKEAIITLTMHKDEADQNLMRLSKELTNKPAKEEAKIIPFSNLNANLPHLSLPTFDGDPRQWATILEQF
ncbi:hypothetical protein WUBG_14383 [Wuchereria bancrofti]|uniref:Uncharacterized protein n=1 Tax=Wuchereria bancrofti TaxID=6293 RepID=J9DY04_WUCBA|nr:hypothetical protein WUBG_14383 [Wuchereria bancrofti]